MPRSKRYSDVLRSELVMIENPKLAVCEVPERLGTHYPYGIQTGQQGWGEPNQSYPALPNRLRSVGEEVSKDLSKMNVVLLKEAPTSPLFGYSAEGEIQPLPQAPHLLLNPEMEQRRKQLLYQPIQRPHQPIVESPVQKLIKDTEKPPKETVLGNIRIKCFWIPCCNKRKPLSNISVSLNNGEKTQRAETNSDGIAEFKRLEIQSYEIKVSSPDYKEQVATLVPEVDPGYSLKEFKLAPIWDLKLIPGIMRSKGWEKGAALMDHWFEQSPYTYPNPDSSDSINRPYNDTIITLDWARTEGYIDTVYQEMWRGKIYQNSAARSWIEKLVKEKSLVSKNSAISFGNLNEGVHKVNNGDWYIQNRTCNTSLFQGLSDHVAALANTSLRMAVEGRTKFLRSEDPFFGGPRDVYQIELKKVGIYIRDSYDFIGSQLGELGYWSAENSDASKTFKDGYHKVENSDFRDWRNENGCGGDFLVYSDMEIRNVSASWEFEVFD